MNFEESCKTKIDILILNAQFAIENYEILMQMRKMQQDNVEILNISPGFYRTVIENCKISLYIELAKLYDNDEKDLNLINLLLKLSEPQNIKQIKSNNKFAVNILKDFNEAKPTVAYFENLTKFCKWSIDEIEKMNDVITKVKTCRNKHFAHFDNSCHKNSESLKTFFEDNKVSYIDFKGLLLLYINICNGLNMFFNNTFSAPLIIGYDDYESTLEYIKLGLEYKNKRIQSVNYTT